MYSGTTITLAQFISSFQKTAIVRKPSHFEIRLFDSALSNKAPYTETKFDTALLNVHFRVSALLDLESHKGKCKGIVIPVCAIKAY
jgi:hypothetical protein